MFCKKLKEFRIIKGYSLSELSKRTKIKSSTLSKYESGAMIPKLDAIKVLCDKLECTPNQILEFDSELNFDSKTITCASIIQSMTPFEKQWVLLTLEGIKLRTESLKQNSDFKI